MTPGRDWDKELARVDRSIAAGAGDVPATGRVGPAAAPAAGNPRERVFTWFRLLLALGLGIAMTQWPYLHGCGLPFFAYLGANSVPCARAAFDFDRGQPRSKRFAVCHPISLREISSPA